LNLNEQVVANSGGALGPDHSTTLTARANLAASYRQAGRIDEAEELITSVASDLDRLFGPKHPSTVATRRAVNLMRRGTSEADSPDAPPPATA
ncbi:tetratricopeptide repeat protein, partial [Kitasatospora sp. NPDC059327]|uniref:tetratricopeptide repeat protein n=1 Tax=Kitasatospora sp. NPDC059327 TaxID=3346803 RepID=UPI0036C789B6